MRKHILFFFILCTVGAASVPVSAQECPRGWSQIQCSYYNEGYADGEGDATSGQSNNYRRYNTKYERRYEASFRDGYEAGFTSARPGYNDGGRWSFSQRSAYDSGYTIGQNDRRRPNQTRSSESLGYDPSIGAYFQQGYSDGFYNRPRQYDVPVGGVIDPPGGGGGNGTAQWRGRVDDRGNIYLRGNYMYTENVNGNVMQTAYQNVNGSLPQRNVSVTARKTVGRGSVVVLQQPSRSNNFTTIIQIYDPRTGADNYGVDISWTRNGGGGGGGGGGDDAYQRGRVTWRGRVDQAVNVQVNGSDVETTDISGTGLSSVDYNIEGYLAQRPTIVTVRKRSGRGSVSVLEQPSRRNGFTAIIRIFDAGGGSDNYDLEISW